MATETANHTTNIHKSYQIIANHHILPFTCPLKSHSYCARCKNSTIPLRIPWVIAGRAGRPSPWSCCQTSRGGFASPALSSLAVAWSLACEPRLWTNDHEWLRRGKSIGHTAGSQARLRCRPHGLPRDKIIMILCIYIYDYMIKK